MYTILTEHIKSNKPQKLGFNSRLSVRVGAPTALPRRGGDLFTTELRKRFSNTRPSRILHLSFPGIVHEVPNTPDRFTCRDICHAPRQKTCRNSFPTFPGTLGGRVLPHVFA